jgi:ferredoxin-NADP reductase
VPQIKPQKHTATVKQIQQISRKVTQVTLSLQNFSFNPGQFINLEVASNTFRAYTLCSNYKTTQEISFLASVAHDGLGANYIKSFKPKEQVYLIGPAGKFSFATPPAKNNLFISTGCGISPFIAMLHKITNDETKNPTNSNYTLLFGEHSEEDVIMEDFLKKCKEMLPNFNYKLCLSKPQNSKHQHIGRVTNFLTKPEVNTHIYLCGNPNMIKQVNNTLTKWDFSKENIFQENWAD